MKTKILASVLALAMVLTLLPVAALAAGSVSAGTKASYTVKQGDAGEDLRQSGDPAIRFEDTVTWGEASHETITLTVTNTDSRALNLVLNGKILNYFDVRWSSGEGVQAVIDPGESATLTITPSANVPVDYPNILSLMEVESRIAWNLRVEITVEVKPVVVTVGEVSKGYGQTLTSADIEAAATTNDDGTLSDLGLVFESEGFAGTAAAGRYAIELNTQKANGNYNFTLAEGAYVVVEAVDPELVTVNATGVYVKSPLSQSELTGQYVNPHTKEAVEGVFTWDDAQQVMDASGTVQAAYTFTPADQINYHVAHGQADVIVSDKIPTEIVVKSGLLVNYDGQPHDVEFAVTPAERSGELTVQYQDKDGNWSQTAPKAVGTYAVKAAIAENETNAAGSATATLTIAPKPIQFYLPTTGTEQALVKNKDYDGTNVGTVVREYFDNNNKLSQLFVSGDDVAFNYDAMTAVFAGVTPGMWDVTVTIDGATALRGKDVGNYQVATQEFKTKSLIFVSPIHITVKDLTKEYGRVITFENADLTAEGLIEGDHVEDVHVSLASAGTAADAAVGTYAITAVSSWGNYKVDKVSGTVTVTQATPETVNVSAGSGKVGNALDTVSTLTGSFRNPYSGEAVPGTLSWADGEEILDTETTHAWVFAPQDSVNYKSVTGTVTVAVAEKTPASISVTVPQDVVYDGVGKAVTATTDAAGATVLVEYKPNGDEAGWTQTAPVDAGTYDVRITVTPAAGSDYAANTVTDTLVIAPATPSGEVTATPAPKAGQALSSAVLSHTFVGVDGKALTGTLTWDTVVGDGADKVTVQAQQSYGWTFTPDDPNYAAVTGAIQCPDVADNDKTDPADPSNPGGDNTGGGTTGGGNTGGGNTGGGNTGGGSRGGSSSGGGGASDAPKPPVTATNANGDTVTTATSVAGDKTVTVTDENGKVIAKVELPATIPALENKFTDVPEGHWAEAAINDMAALNVVKGVSVEGHVFDMDSNITRGAMAQILFNLSQGQKGMGNTFADAQDDWYTDAVAWAAGAGVVNGYSDTAFGPNDAITRQQLATMLYRYAGLLALDTAAEADLSTFVDGDMVDDWASDAVTWAVAKGLIQGKGANNLDPFASASRAETAVVLSRFLELI